MKAVDSANTIEDQNWFEEAYADGFRLYVIHAVTWGTCTPWPNTERQLAMALRAGLKIAVYTRDPTCWQDGILAAGEHREQLQFYAIDVEDDPGVAVTLEMVRGIEASGVRPIIYSSSTMWPAVMGDGMNQFSHVPLWDGLPTIVQYGGWNSPQNMRIGVQTEWEYPLRGINVDLSYFNSEFLR